MFKILVIHLLTICYCTYRSYFTILSTLFAGIFWKHILILTCISIMALSDSLTFFFCLEFTKPSSDISFFLKNRITGIYLNLVIFENLDFMYNTFFLHHISIYSDQRIISRFLNNFL